MLLYEVLHCVTQVGTSLGEESPSAVHSLTVLVFSLFFYLQSFLAENQVRSLEDADMTYTLHTPCLYAEKGIRLLSDKRVDLS